MAAGLGLDEAQLADFEMFLIDRARTVFSVLTVCQLLPQPFCCRLQLCIGRWSGCCWSVGAGHAEPRFVITHCRLKKLRWIGKEKAHLSVLLDDGTDTPLRAVSFGIAGTKLGQFLAATPDPGPVRVLGRLQRDNWRGGGAVQFLIEDISAS